ncbi:hypothetical protein B1992_08330 [Pseudoxanthomonas broegbernensis]|uniref:DUF4870 domain-containing protein n=1 Tax=Pseudoxanthomonas broegbernensis TaxID=83619 RepID=A0A7V8GM21_9GAMM|nr:DUF4870 domain-containing protein [Pseudoxanthomonas broegbernensis]KAF1686231.1 hypothetical protein B1992_08330 [Pseudoxanthomonas broegbernensis]MBB6063900.1 hypothetical protein [Pseudoxanthomonas broegbernensis]
MSEFDNVTAPPPAPVGGSSNDDRTVALLVHLSGIILGFIVPLIVWLINKDKPEKGFLNDQSKEALNFQITLLFVYIVGTVLTIILIGALINFAAWIACIVFSIIAGLAANKGEAYRYPFAIRLIK